MLQAAVQLKSDLEYPDLGIRSLQNAFQECESRFGRPATNLEICSELGISLREFYSLLDLNKGIGMGRVDEYADGSEGSHPLIKYFPDPEDDECYCLCSKSEFSSAMARALEALPRNEKLVVSLHHNEDLAFPEIAEIFGISQTRVAQIHTTAMLRIRGKLQSAISDDAPPIF